MKKLSLVIYSFLLSLVLSFAQKIPVMKKEASSIAHHIDVYTALQSKAPVLTASDFVEDIEFVPLETTDECLLGENIMSLVVTQTDILVYDFKGCYRFDRKGKFLNRIGTSGNGPGEYLSAMYVTVDTLNRWVYMGDYNQKKFVKYDYSGKHLAT